MVSQAAISWNRLHLADISYPMFLRSFIFYNRKPGSVTRLLTLTYPFSGRTWLAFLSTILAVIMTMLLTNLQLRRRGQELTLHQAVVVSISPLLSDGVPRHWEHVWRSRYGFLVLLVWLPGGLLLSSAYTSNLLANLISVESEQTVDTFQQLVDNGHMLVLLKNTVLSPLMKNSPRAAVRQAYKVNIHCCFLLKNPAFHTHTPFRNAWWSAAATTPRSSSTLLRSRPASFPAPPPRWCRRSRCTV